MISFNATDRFNGYLLKNLAIQKFTYIHSIIMAYFTTWEWSVYY